MPRTSPGFRTATGVAIGVALLFLLPSAGSLVPGASAAPPAPARSDPSPGPTHVAAFVHPPPLGRGHSPASIRPAAGQVWYTQEGATLAQFNNSSVQAGVKSLSVDILLVNSPYPIGYELNGLTNRGDWYQVVIGVNWPGCSGLEMITEVWDNAQGSGPVGCDTTVTMSVGDLIRLGLNFSTGSSICMDLTDVTRSRSHSICQAQPNTGATEFITLGSTSDANGYFTGPMTEIANTSASSCPDYTHMPLVNYEWPGSFGLTAYVGWSDEFELTTFTSCYSNSGGVTTFTPGDPATAFLDTASGTSFGPHWVSGQPLWYFQTPYGFRIQTDALPLTALTLSASSITIPLGGNTTLTAVVSGGTSPYFAFWALNGTIFANGTLQRLWIGTAGGLYRFQVYGIDKHLDVIGPSSTVSVRVNGPLAVSSITTSLTTGNADIGQTATFSVVASGGLPPYGYAWVGVPAECPSVNTASLVCVPAAVGSYSIQVHVTDANASSLNSPSRTFVVSTAPSARLFASARSLDIGQSASFVANVTGGSGNLSYAWAGLPPPCLAANTGSIQCTVTTSGLYTTSFSITDSNGAMAQTSALAVQVFVAPTISLRVDRAIADAGVALTFTASPAGGSGGFVMSWSGLPVGCTSSNAVLLVCSPTAGGTYSVTASASDSVGGIATSTPVVVYAYPPLNVSVSGPSTVLVGAQLDAAANVSGGAPGVSYQWTGLPAGCTPTSAARLTCQPSISGEFNITVTATDGGGGVSSTTFRLVVVYPPSNGPNGTTGIPMLWLLIGAGAAILLGAVAAAALARRRR